MIATSPLTCYSFLLNLKNCILRHKVHVSFFIVLYFTFTSLYIAIVSFGVMHIAILHSNIFYTYISLQCHPLLLIFQLFFIDLNFFTRAKTIEKGWKWRSCSADSFIRLNFNCIHQVSHNSSFSYTAPGSNPVKEA